MNKRLLLGLMAIIFMSSAIRSQEESNIRKLTAETNHSSLIFSVPIANGITRITGRFNEFSIDMNLVNDDLEQSSIWATIKTESIDTGIGGRDEHLRTEDFFNTEKYPEITLESKEIKKMGNMYLMIATLTMHGVSKDIQVPIEMTGRDGKNTFGFKARFSVNRTEFGVGNSFQHTDIENFLAEDIDVEVDFWTKRRKAI